MGSLLPNEDVFHSLTRIIYEYVLSLSLCPDRPLSLPKRPTPFDWPLSLPKCPRLAQEPYNKENINDRFCSY